MKLHYIIIFLTCALSLFTMSSPWNQFFGVIAPGLEILPFPTWMEHYPSADDIPIWLETYKLVHLANQGDSFLTRMPTLTPSEDQSNEHKAVHALYHASFTDEKDREDMLLALKVGHTIAILDYNGLKPLRAIGAITFIYARSKMLTGIVLYLNVDAEFRRSGFGSYLISLMGSMISYRTNKNEVAICLYANSHQNQTSLSFYRKLGFVQYEDPKQERPLPKAARLIMKCTSVYNTFFDQDEGMIWLYISDFHDLPLAETCQMSIMNPDVVINEETGKVSVCDATYCQYPCGLIYADLCCVNEDLPLFQNEVFSKTMTCRHTSKQK
jgi:ribosomal protein S18 acetylase RimI-like enzyme